MSDPEVSEDPDTGRYHAECMTPSDRERADRYLARLFPELNRSRIQRAIEEGRVRVNGRAVVKKTRFEPGDQVELEALPLISAKPEPVCLPLNVVYEDEAIIVVNKSPGMVVHPGNGTGKDTLVHALLHHCGDQLSRWNGEDRPGIVHRLDRDTSGLIVAAKTDAACQELLRCFKEREVEKHYLAVVIGMPRQASGVVEAPIGRHPVHRTRMAVTDQGRAARTDWWVRGGGTEASLLQCQIHTGRTHQIRVHLSHLGHPIIGDTLYGYRRHRRAQSLPLPPGRPLLHAWRLAIRHPVSGEPCEWTASLPDDLRHWIRAISDSASPPFFDFL